MGFITIFQNHLRSYFWRDFARGFEKRTSYPYAPWDWNIYLHESHKISVKCSQIYHTWSILVGFMVEEIFFGKGRNRRFPRVLNLMCRKTTAKMAKSNNWVGELFHISCHDIFYK